MFPLAFAADRRCASVVGLLFNNARVSHSCSIVAVMVLAGAHQTYFDSKEWFDSQTPLKHSYQGLSAHVKGTASKIQTPTAKCPRDYSHQVTAVEFGANKAAQSLLNGITFEVCRWTGVQ